MSYYPVVGDIAKYQSFSEKNHYLILEVTVDYREVFAHLLCLEDGERIDDYFWPLASMEWSKVA